ncbi:Uncharacterized conserved protein [Chitinophaga sp. CF118]|uniref:esterase-like activity of phytase family protein n=1 Tax=Chitinophaga sp. CF118 TaxID=1884367 RepID=UPI0008E19B7A|nr:esterase-like activity of phytase family protein [Chitinophaga sp. CF118]SFD32825.1 Uncharacterized conserved protein [Chitinophaga sp. CF118]
MKKYWLFCILLTGCSVTHKTTTPAVSQLRFIHKYIVPYNLSFNGTTVGGLSGIDYDTARKVYYLICDDRSEKQSARFYTARIPLTGDSIVFTSVTSLRMNNGNVYPGTKNMAPDPEAMRYNPHTGKLIWSSEGERIVSDKDTILKDPGVYEINKNGYFTDSFAIPSLFRMQATNAGPRRNGTFEGLGFTSDGRYLFVSLEEPRYEDGPRAGFTDTTAYIRILKYDLHTRQPVAQFAYKLAPVAHRPVPADKFYTNGISDILVLSDTQLLIMERSFSIGTKDCTIRLFVANLDHATDVSNIHSLQATKVFTPVKKTPLFNFDSLHTYVDNVEGMTFGPRLPNGHRSIIFVADNNFSAEEEMQFYLFEVE